MSDQIIFVPNVPQVLSLTEVSGELDGFNVHYPTSDGRVLTLSRPQAVKLNQLEVEPGQTFGICKRRSTERRQPTTWDLWLTPETEKVKAAQEIAAGDLEPLLSKSIEQVRGRVHEIPCVAVEQPPEPAVEIPATGTYGPIPKRHPARQERPQPIPYNVAFREVLAFIHDGLKQAGLQWNDQAVQDAVCTILISAAKQGLLSCWERKL